MPASINVGGWGADVMDLESNINAVSNELTLTSNTNEEEQLGDGTDEVSIGTADREGGDARRLRSLPKLAEYLVRVARRLPGHGRHALKRCRALFVGADTCQLLRGPPSPRGAARG